MAKFGFISAFLLIALLTHPVGAADKQDRTAGSVAADYKQLNKEFEDARQEYFKAYSNAKTDEERKKLKYPDTRAHARRLLALAEKDANDPAAVEPLVEALMHGRYDKEVGPNALELLKTHHLESEKLARACQIMTFGPSREEARKFLELAL